MLAVFRSDASSPTLLTPLLGIGLPPPERVIVVRLGLRVTAPGNSKAKSAPFPNAGKDAAPGWTHRIERRRKSKTRTLGKNRQECGTRKSHGEFKSTSGCVEV